ncbi:L-histidine N(alpha)-methyltransferase [Flexibacterium corallicola]|uniref:L-histidine N(alpha)-methyltransferase n=1 Tax=Flexibacterium corallicola TaxID=3037259 RepID=UPI00286F224D|nr:L-histidine N(alpha)-methyltransferase [Pseudovibrio sp. M1P-2-3]
MSFSFQLERPLYYNEPFLFDIWEGCARDQKKTSPRWLYDAKGSELFDRITELPEYYPTRTEFSILHKLAAKIGQILGPRVSLVEYGAGSGEKAQILLEATQDPFEYVPLDISFDHMEEGLVPLKREFPSLRVRPMEGDFLSLEENVGLGAEGAHVGFFPGSTIGNLNDTEIAAFMKGARQQLGEDSYFILGADLCKSLDVLIPAYDDAQGVTREFNLNLLTRINRELHGTFESRQFSHVARWNAEDSAIEMHIQSLSAQSFSIAGRTFSMTKGESIHTESSRKFTPESLEHLVQSNGWEIEFLETDNRQYFAVLLLKALPYKSRGTNTKLI